MISVSSNLPEKAVCCRTLSMMDIVQGVAYVGRLPPGLSPTWGFYRHHLTRMDSKSSLHYRVVRPQLAAFLPTAGAGEEDLNHSSFLGNLFSARWHTPLVIRDLPEDKA